ncbi:MAG: TolC family outer membrane protein [Magnetococcales bacterium]|nr:TolC family outer membrane protein [Magnetococcales bacterium]
MLKELMTCSLLKIKIFITILSVSVLLWAFPIAALHAADLSGTVLKALSFHPTIKASQEALKAVKQDVKIQLGGFYPVISVKTEMGQEATNGDISNPHGVSNSAEISLTQNIFDGKSTTYSIKSAKRLKREADFVLYDDRETITLQAAEAYLKILRFRAVVKLSQENLKKHQEVHEKVQLRTRQGGGDLGDVFQSESRLIRSKSRLRQVEGDLRNAETDFFEVVGSLPEVELDEAIVLEDTIPKTVEEAIAKAIAKNPALRAIQENSKSKEADVSAIKSSLYPTLDLELKYTNEYHSDTVAGSSEDMTALFVMNFDLYRGNQDTSRWKQAKHRKTESLRLVDEQRRLLEEQIRVDFENYQIAIDRLPMLSRLVEVNSSVVQSYMQQFELGRRTLLDVLDAHDDLYQAMVGVVEERDRLRLNEYRILSAFGQLETSLSPS